MLLRERASAVISPTAGASFCGASRVRCANLPNPLTAAAIGGLQSGPPSPIQVQPEGWRSSRGAMEITAGAAGFLIPCFDSGAASHRGAAGVLGTCNQRCDFGSPGGFSAFIWPLRGRYFLCHFWIRDGLLLRRSVRTARRSDQVLRQAHRAHRAPLLDGYS